MNDARRTALAVSLVLWLLGVVAIAPLSGQKAPPEPLFPDPIDVNVPPISADPAVRVDFDIVYVRALRDPEKHKRWFTEIATPVFMLPGADLVLLHPDGSEEVLVKAGPTESITDPAVSFDGQWVYYVKFHDVSKGGQHDVAPGGSDIYKIHLSTRKTVQLTRQRYSPNTGAAPKWTSDFRRLPKEDHKSNYIHHGVYHTGPCPLPGGRLMFTSSRNGYMPPKHPAPVLQLFVMDDVDDSGEAERNIEQIGYLNIGMALHPTVLKDGRVMFSSLESQGLRSGIEWGLWLIDPDGTDWLPMISAFRLGGGAPNAFHFQTQLSDGSIVAEEYYNQNNSGFGAYYTMPPPGDYGYKMGPANVSDPRNPRLRAGRHDNGKGRYSPIAFSPEGIEALTPFAHAHDGPADRAVRGDKTSPGTGKFAHPSGAPGNHLLTSYSTGPSNHQYNYPPQIDSGIYLIKSGKPVNQPAEMRLIRNDPRYNEHMPRAVASYKRIYGIDEPAQRPALANDGKLSPHLPAGTPFGLVGTSSLYKRETFPRGAVPDGEVAAVYPKEDRSGYRGLERFNSSDESTGNWKNQGADAGWYAGDDIHAVRILAMEPTTARRRGEKSGRLFHSHASERLRILGEIPVRKFGADGKQPIDPDGNPDTSFLAKIPADTAFTFQTLDRNGAVLNMAQTWHQVRPGEVRNNCGGCHAHSQEPTPFEQTAAASPDYKLYDLTRNVPLLTDKARDEGKKQLDVKDATGVRYTGSTVHNVEFHRDVRPILNASCVGCHNGKYEAQMGKLALDDLSKIRVHNGPEVPNAYFRLAEDNGPRSQFGNKPIWHESRWCFPNASRYVRMFQSRRSLLVWKILGERTDGFRNDDFPTEAVPGDASTLLWQGKPIEPTRENIARADLDFNGKRCPPPEAIAGAYVAPDGQKIKVTALSDEDKRTIIRWIDLGCPIDLDYDAADPAARGYGWMLDDNRPTLALSLPQPGENAGVDRIRVSFYDYDTGIDPGSFSVKADIAIDDMPPGAELAAKFKPVGENIYEWRLATPILALKQGTLNVLVRDRQGNRAQIDRTFKVTPTTADRAGR